MPTKSDGSVSLAPQAGQEKTMDGGGMGFPGPQAVHFSG
jgi:hypothetical protein